MLDGRKRSNWYGEAARRMRKVGAMANKRIESETKISGKATVGDWASLRARLLEGLCDVQGQHSTPVEWERAIMLFDVRIKTRFLDPVDWILERGARQGEGFAVMAVLCILIEFLESFRQGVTFVNGARTQPNEYNSSRLLFRSFLTTQDPFNQYFHDTAMADGFYANIRCGLLHEASTKHTSKIKATRDHRIIECIPGDTSNFVVYREQFHLAVKNYVERYREELREDQALQRAFLRRMDDICGIRRKYYFAYGSNMNRERLRERVHVVHKGQNGVLEGYRFRYNKMSKIDGTGKANICEAADEVVHGVCYELDEEGLDILDQFEKGYERRIVPVCAVLGGPVIALAYTYIAKCPPSGSTAGPSAEYRALVLAAAHTWRLPADYIESNL